MHPEKLKTMGRTARTLAKPEATRTVVDICLEVACKVPRRCPTWKSAACAASAASTSWVSAARRWCGIAEVLLNLGYEGPAWTSRPPP